MAAEIHGYEVSPVDADRHEASLAALVGAVVITFCALGAAVIVAIGQAG